MLLSLVGYLTLAALLGACGAPQSTVPSHCGVWHIPTVKWDMGLNWYSLWERSGAQEAGVSLEEFVCQTHELNPDSMALPKSCRNPDGTLDTRLQAFPNAKGIDGQDLYDSSDWSLDVPLYGSAYTQ